MKQLSAAALTGLAVDIEAELDQLQHLAADIRYVRDQVESDPTHARLFYENLALKLHNFYTGCERIFNLVAAELNGAPVAGYDWHQRLLERMAVDWDGRPPVLSTASVRELQPFRAFRHVVRNIYGYELDTQRVEQLVQDYARVWPQVEADMRRFAAWLRSLAQQL